MHASSGIQTHYHSARAEKDSSYFRLRTTMIGLHLILYTTIQRLTSLIVIARQNIIICNTSKLTNRTSLLIGQKI
jgi:hypothetical protein